MPAFLAEIPEMHDDEVFFCSPKIEGCVAPDWDEVRAAFCIDFIVGNSKVKFMFCAGSK